MVEHALVYVYNRWGRPVLSQRFAAPVNSFRRIRNEKIKETTLPDTFKKGEKPESDQSSAAFKAKAGNFHQAGGYRTGST